ncbi:MAG: chorismate mutase [Syntrophomonas sp.]|nr:chorismate mutase [Syntrophomonas sp.]
MVFNIFMGMIFGFESFISNLQSGGKWHIDITVTADIRSAFPAAAARAIGWDKVPLLCFQEIEVPDSLPRCIRVLLHVNTVKNQQEIKHIYLKAARSLRRDLNR